MISAGHFVVLLAGLQLVSSQNLVCQKEVWLPSNSTLPPADNCRPYDGSLIPNCQYFLNNVTSYYHVHEYGEIKLIVMAWLLSVLFVNDNQYCFQTAASSGNVAPQVPVCFSVENVSSVDQITGSALTAGQQASTLASPWSLWSHLSYTLAPY